MIILYHANCNDGSASALAAWMKLGDAGNHYVAVTHGKPPPQAVIGEDVLIVDFCYPRDVLINMGARSIQIIDHHISAQKDLAQPFDKSSGIKAHFDMTKSGAALTWHYFFPNTELPLFFKYIQDRDIWTKRYPQSSWLNYGLNVYSQDFRGWQQLIVDPDKLEQTINIGKSIYTYVKQEAEKIMASAVYLSIAGFKVPVINAPGFMASDILNTVLLQDPKAPFAAAYFDLLDEATRYYSLRSDDQREDVSIIAKQFGGGGHRNAAGFSLPIQLTGI